MKKYLVIGNPINHSLSPKLHNYWLNKHEINAVYEKKEINDDELEAIILDIKNEKIHGINVTVPFKKLVIPHLDELTTLANITQSVNTVYKKGNLIIGDNTDITGFELAIKRTNYNLKNKSVFILGAGGVVPSIILALKKMEVSKIILSNRTRKKAEELKNIFVDLQILNWGDVPKFDIIINATSIGLKKDDEIKLNYKEIGSNKLFYDVIYNPAKTNFLVQGEKSGNQIENGKMMLIYQASAAFKKWHGVQPSVDNEIIKLFNL
jgi:shikimate dehydrogenase